MYKLAAWFILFALLSGPPLNLKALAADSTEATPSAIAAAPERVTNAYPKKEEDVKKSEPQADIVALRAKAEAGDAEARYDLGCRYMLGEGVEQDSQQAVAWLTKAAEKGHMGAQTRLGDHYSSLFEEFDLQRGRKWYTVAAEKGFAPAQVGLGRSYVIPYDFKKAFEWFDKAASQGYADGEEELGRLYAYGHGVTKDLEKAFSLYKKAALQGHAFAQYELGECYAYGEGVPENKEEAVVWYKKAAEQDEGFGIFKLGLCYAEGEGVTKDLNIAKVWWSRLQSNAIKVKIKQVDVEVPNSRKAFAEDYVRAVEHDDAEAQCRIGDCYFEGRDVRKDAKRAEKWYRDAAERGVAWAQYKLGELYAQGQTVPKNMQQAVSWYQKSSLQGFQTAQFALGMCYAEGEGVPKDLVSAYVWFNIAASQGDVSAAQNRTVLEKQMTPDQVARAQQLSAAFIPKTSKKGSAEPREGNSVDETPGNLVGSGTGFFVAADGWLVTNAHVAMAGGKAMVKVSDKFLPAEVKHVDKANDLALIKVDGQFECLAIEHARGVTLGTSVFTVGFPNPGLQGFSPKMTTGEISSLAGIKDDPRYFQISAPIQPGNSGGALADESGNVVGVVSQMISDTAAIATTGAIPQNVNYAVKSTYLLALAESVPEAAKGLKEPVRRQDLAAAVQAVEKASAMVLMFE